MSTVRLVRVTVIVRIWKVSLLLHTPLYLGKIREPVSHVHLEVWTVEWLLLLSYTLFYKEASLILCVLPVLLLWAASAGAVEEAKS